MTETIRLYFRYAGVCLRSKMQYRASFIMLTVGQFLGLLTEALAVLFLFQRFGNLKGWSLPEVGLLYGLTHASFAMAEGFARGFDQFSGMIRDGGFDRILVRPRSTTLQIAGSDFDGRIGRLMLGVSIIVWSLTQIHVVWNLTRLILIFSILAGTTCLFYGLFVIQAALCFWTVEGLEIMNAVTYGGAETGSYPLSIYRTWFQHLFTYVVPLGWITYFPAVILLGRPNESPLPSPLLWISPIVGAAFLCACFSLWNLGVRRYRSTGS